MVIIVIISIYIILTLFILHLVFYSFLKYFEDERREWLIVVMCEERETIKKIMEIYIFIKYSVK